MSKFNYLINCYEDELVGDLKQVIEAAGAPHSNLAIELTDITLIAGSDMKGILEDWVKSTRNQIGVEIWEEGKTHETAEEDGAVEYLSLKHENLYEQDWLGEELENWLDNVEDSNLWDLKAGDSSTHGKKKVSIKCVEDNTHPHPDEPENPEVKRRIVKYALSLKGAEDILIEYELDLDDEDSVFEKAAFYSDDDGNDTPLQNFTWDKWSKAF